MQSYSLSHLSDQTLLRDLAVLVNKDRVTTAALLAHLAEVDARRLYLPAAHPSMYDYCLAELRFSEDTACKRIRAARAARQFPQIFSAVAEGRLSLSAVVLLAPHLTPADASELLAAAANRSKLEIGQLLAERFPRPETPARVVALDSIPLPTPPAASLPSGLVDSSAPGRMEAGDLSVRVAPVAPRRFALQFTVGQDVHNKLRHARDLLGHALPSGDLARCSIARSMP